MNLAGTPDLSGIPSCCVCGTSFAGRRFLVSWWGDRYCDGHPTCVSCQRPLPAGVLAGAPGMPPPATCDSCRHHAVTIRDEAVRALLRVNAWMDRYGLGLVVTDVPLRFMEGSPDDPHPAHTLTQEVVRTSWDGRATSTREITGIEIVRGMTTVQCSSILAHELTHAWLFLQRVGLTPGPVEEGAAEFVRSLWLREQTEREAEYRLACQDENRDPTYGEGFRWVRDRYRGEPLPQFLWSLRG